jgi:hypothetical protein
MAPFWISLEGVRQDASTACSVFGILYKSDGLSYDPVDRNRFILVARQKVSWNVKPCPFLIVSQLSGNKSSESLWHAIDISHNWLNRTKAYTTFNSNASQVMPSVSHDQIVHSFGSFIVGGTVWPPRPLIISNALPAPLKFSSPFFNSVSNLQ